MRRRIVEDNSDWNNFVFWDEIEANVIGRNAFKGYEHGLGVGKKQQNISLGMGTKSCKWKEWGQ